MLKPKCWSFSTRSNFVAEVENDGLHIGVKGTGDIRFDFGQNNAGWLEFDSPDLNGAVEMSVSEFNEPLMALSTFPKKTMVPKKHGNTYRLELNPELYEGVQYGWIHIRSLNKTWHINNVRLVCQVRPVNYKGSFSCSDTLLTRIWYTGAYTVKLNLLKDYFGAILIDRSDRYSWTGDAHPSQAASLVAFGNYEMVKQNLAHTSDQSNGIRSYELYWVLSLIDYYYHTGDAKTVTSYIANACKKMDDAFKVYNTNPSLVFYGWDERLGAGFEHPDNKESQNAYKMLSIRAWVEFAKAMKALGRMDLYNKYNTYASEKITALRNDSRWYEDFGLHAGADAVNTRLLSLIERKFIYLKSFTDPVNRVSYSPFNQYFIIQAFALMDKYDQAIGSIKDLWGGQIAYGGSTFFEVYRPSWNAVIGRNSPVPNNQCGFTSLCHPWGAGVTKWLSEEVLGIRPTAPGFERVDIVPHLGRSITNVAGTMPTPKGEVRASFNVLNGQCSITIPQKTIARIGIPKVEKNIVSVTVNNKVIWGKKHVPNEYVASVSQDDSFIYLNGVNSGHYKIFIHYKGNTPKLVDVPVNYAAKCVQVDKLTGGNWGGKYGKDGYVLCNYLGDGKDIQQLPAYVSSLTYYKKNGNTLPSNNIWLTNTTDDRALAPDSKNGFPRSATCIYAMDTDQTGITYTVTVNLKQEKDYKISLYFVDWDDKARETAVEMFDEASLKLIAPVKVIKDMRRGTYITYAYNRSARFRINIVRGPNATLSGLFIDPANQSTMLPTKKES
ncbi:alpha-L-rhamnosidase C-terminal domain-containing protein [Mucilaginibacter limnophilus]|uniref:alpha-L-rhamnosidase C-terminal domain-containing protein n=1 Tax=Mucilaginibacter limnophilus TaxID=1932778 RepID=UPI0013E39BB6|nr:alpha-L-rhamnosidase C-terminal domain-containing protein [Mucilaginibacter limnophilus]